MDKPTNSTDAEAIQNRVLWEIVEERARQDRKFGPQNNHPPERWLVILMEEVGEVSNAILEEDKTNYVAELIQVAAVAVAAVESFRIQQQRNNKK